MMLQQQMLQPLPLHTTPLRGNTERTDSTLVHPCRLVGCINNLGESLQQGLAITAEYDPMHNRVTDAILAASRARLARVLERRNGKVGL